MGESHRIQPEYLQIERFNDSRRIVTFVEDVGFPGQLPGLGSGIDLLPNRDVDDYRLVCPPGLPARPPSGEGPSPAEEGDDAWRRPLSFGDTFAGLTPAPPRVRARQFRPFMDDFHPSPKPERAEDSSCVARLSE